MTFVKICSGCTNMLSEVTASSGVATGHNVLQGHPFCPEDGGARFISIFIPEYKATHRKREYSLHFSSNRCSCIYLSHEIYLPIDIGNSVFEMYPDRGLRQLKLNIKAYPHGSSLMVRRDDIYFYCDTNLYDFSQKIARLEGRVHQKHVVDTNTYQTMRKASPS
jgi:hypothetical protein